MIQALLDGEKDPAQIADLARRSVRGKISVLQKALEGHLTEHHHFLLQLLWKEENQNRFIWVCPNWVDGKFTSQNK